MTFVIKDSGERQQFESGMVRDVATDKTFVALVFDGPMFWRWAVHLTKGAVKYAKRNWMKANGEAEYERFKDSAARHFYQWYRGDVDEDHAAAVFFNINGAEYVKEKMAAPKDCQEKNLPKLFNELATEAVNKPVKVPSRYPLKEDMTQEASRRKECDVLYQKFHPLDAGGSSLTSAEKRSLGLPTQVPPVRKLPGRIAEPLLTASFRQPQLDD